MLWKIILHLDRLAKDIRGICRLRFALLIWLSHILQDFRSYLAAISVFCYLSNRWEHTPLSEAKEFAHTEVQHYLEQYINAQPDIL